MNSTLYCVPGDFVRRFTRHVAVHYPGGTIEAVQDLMRKALKDEQTLKMAKRAASS